MDEQTLRRLSIPDDAQQPELMALGDSLFNGCRSMTVTDALSQTSLPGMVANAMGADSFVEGRYPDPRTLLIDFEDVLRCVTGDTLVQVLVDLLDKLPRFSEEAQRNALAWFTGFAQPARPDRPLFYDNLAVAGARVEDMFQDTLATVAARCAAMQQVIAVESSFAHWRGRLPVGAGWAYLPDPNDPDSAQRWAAMDAHIQINMRHKLNPSNDPRLMPLRAIDQVRLRRPQVLLVNLGANHGIGSLALQADSKGGMASLTALVKDIWPRAAAELAAVAVAADIKTVVVTVICRPSQVFNLMPWPWFNHPTHEPPPDYPQPREPGGYFDCYVPALSTSLDANEAFPLAVMKHLDDEVDAIREAFKQKTIQVFKAAGAYSRLLLVDYAEVFAGFDSKHDMAKALKIGRRKYTTHAFDRLQAGGIRGGGSGLDNFHPSLVSYRIVARAFCRALKLPEKDWPRVDDVGDTLLADPPAAALILLHAIATTRLGAPCEARGSGRAQHDQALLAELRAQGLGSPHEAWGRLTVLNTLRR